MPSRGPLESCFRYLRSLVIPKHPQIDVGLILDDEFDWDPKRGFAYCERQTDNTFLIGVAPRMVGAAHSRMMAILMHEFGHAVLLYRGQEDHTERQADLAAEKLFNTPIFYDDEDLQTVDAEDNTRPRPMYLDDSSGCTLAPFI